MEKPILGGSEPAMGGGGGGGLSTLGGFGAPHPRCQHENPADQKFCGECGVPLEAGGKFASPEAYTPQHLAEKILTSRSALEGERKHVTVLFADMKGSMEVLADRDPEEACKLLDPVLERMMEAVHRYEGTVNQVMGDGIMALFGVPVAHEDHAVRACYAALDMQAAIRQYAQEVARTHGIEPQIRVGLNAGEVVVGAIGSDLRMEYTAVGQTTHLAARMEQLATPGATLLTADLHRLVEGYVAVRPYGPVRVKGLQNPVEVYEMIGVGPLRSRFHAAAKRGLTRFVGRETELEHLRQALRWAGAGRGQAVTIVGEPGVGKSRLLWEVTHSYRTHGWLIVRASSVSYGKATPYLPVIDLLRGYFRIENRDDPRTVRERVTGKVLTLDPALEPMLAALLALLDVPIEDAAWQALDPPQRRQRTLDAVTRLLLREAQVQPLLVVFEDLHWVDAETRVFLDRLVESIAAARLLLLANTRPEYEPPWGSKSNATQIRLDSLPPESADELLQALLGGDPSLPPLKRLLIERTEGNPFFLEESVRTLVETAVLSGERGAYALAQTLPTIQVPATVQAVLAARIDRLSLEDKRLLQSASVIGKNVPLPLLQAIAELPEEALSRGLARLRAAEFLYQTRCAPEPEYTFKHALTHEVAYGSLLHERRRLGHGRIVDAIERLYADRLAEQVERLAAHSLSAQHWEKAVTYCAQAGHKAFAHSANRQAVECLEHALEALQHLPETRERRERAVDLRFDVRTALHPLGDFQRILDHLREAEALATSLGDQRRLGWVSAYMTLYLWYAGDKEQAREAGERAVAISDALGDFALQVSAICYLSFVYFLVGDYRRGTDLVRRAVTAIEGDLVRERFGMVGLPAVVSRTSLAWCLAEVGAFKEAIARAEEAMSIAVAVGQPYNVIVACCCVGVAHLRQGAIDKAIPVLEHGLRLCQQRNIPLFLRLISSHLGYAYALSGRVAAGLPLLQGAVEQSAAMKIVGNLSLTVAYLSEASLMAGRTEDALRTAQQALKLSREHGERGNVAWSLRVLGEISASADGPDIETAEGYYLQAMARALELDMGPLMAHCHLGLGELYRRCGKWGPAHEHLTAATAAYRDMEMPFWLKKAEAAMTRLEGCLPSSSPP